MASQFAPKLNLFDATMIVISGIIGSGIFINPYIVAQTVKTPFLILAVWVAGGLIALTGAFVFAELSTVMPKVGGQYAFFREAFHPLVAFLHGWSLLLIIQSGATAGVAIAFAKYLRPLLNLPEKFVADRRPKFPVPYPPQQFRSRLDRGRSLVCPAIPRPA